jgi:hypothetical protein
MELVFFNFIKKQILYFKKLKKSRVWYMIYSNCV